MNKTLLKNNSGTIIRVKRSCEQYSQIHRFTDSHIHTSVSYTHLDVYKRQAYTTGIVKPNIKRIMNGSLTAGFLLPLIFLILWNSLDTKVHTKEHIFALMPSSTAVIAEVPVKSEENEVVHPNDFSTFAESFRILSSNLKYMLKTRPTEGGAVVLVTSSIKGEGKTTISINTCLLYTSRCV